MLNYRFRLYPTEEQRKILDTTIETCRHLYKDSLGERSQDWDVGFYEQKQLLVLRKQENKSYKQVHSQVLQDVILRLDKAYQAFFRKIMKSTRSMAAFDLMAAGSSFHALVLLKSRCIESL